MSPLFRSEAVEFRRNRLEGDIVLTRSVPLSIITGLLIATTGALALWVGTGTYRRIETVPGEVLPVGSYLKVFAARAGHITWIGVEDGQEVRQGQVIATIQIEEALIGGALPGTERLASVSRQLHLLGQQIGYSLHLLDRHRALISRHNRPSFPWPKPISQR